MTDPLTACFSVAGERFDDSSFILKTPNVRSRFLRSSGRTPLFTEEANRCEVNTHRRKPAKSEPIIIISDDESDGSLSSSDPQPSLQPQSKPEFSDSLNIGCERTQVDSDSQPPCIQPIATIDPGQESAVPDSSSVRGLLQRLENGLKQAISLIEVKWGTFTDFCPFISSSLEEIQRVGGIQLADRCEQKLADWLILAYRVDSLVFSNSCNEIRQLIGEARVKASRERTARERKISIQEAVFVDSHVRQRHLQREIDFYHGYVDRTGIKTIQGEKTLRSFMRECTRVQGITEHARQVLEAMRREHAAAIAADFEEKFEKEAKAQVQANREKKLAAVKAELASFTILDCA